MHVIGTAGHVDHGKSTLVLALTGINPDRLREEQEREMTIDLGFAWLTLPNGDPVGIVDVPGHRDFIENMLAGVGGIDAALFVVAADEGVMPQTREHLAILDLLGVDKGVVALTKTDIAESEEWIGLVAADVSETLEGTVLEDAEDIKMLPGLRHHALIGSDDKEGGVDAAYTCQHIFNKVPVAGHIYDAHRLAVGECEPGKAQVDRHLPFLLLAQPVGVDAREGQDEGRLAVVYVAGGADDVHLWIPTLLHRAAPGVPR